MVFSFSTQEETCRQAESLGRLLKAGDVIALVGPLGVGKTTFVTGIAKGLGLPTNYRVTSPTFVYAQIYPCTVPLYHVDLYRIENAKHLEQTGVHEMVGGDGVAMVEWFDLYPELWRGDRLEIQMSFLNQTERNLTCTPYGTRPSEILNRWRS